MENDTLQIIFSFYGIHSNIFTISKNILSKYLIFCEKNALLDVSKYPSKASRFMKLYRVREIQMVHSRVQDLYLYLPANYEILNLKPFGKLKKIILTGEFNGRIEFPDSLEYISFNFLYDQPFQEPSSVRYLNLGVNFNRELKSDSEIIYFSMKFNRDFLVSQKTKKIYTGCEFRSELVLPSYNNLRSLVINNYSQNHVLHCPTSLESLVWKVPTNNVVLNKELIALCWHCDLFIDFSCCKQLKRLYWNSNCRKDISWKNLTNLEEVIWNCDKSESFPLTLKKLIFKGTFQYPFLMDESLLELHLSYDFDSDIQLPTCLQVLEVGRNFKSNIIWNENIQTLIWRGPYNVKMPDTIRELHWISGASFSCPLKLEKLFLGWSFSKCIIVPKKVHIMNFPECAIILVK